MTSINESLPAGVEEAHTRTMRDLNDNGAHLAAEVDGKDRSTSEILDFQTGMSNPLARVLASGEKPWNTLGAVARFTWLIAGSDRLADIAYYEPMVQSYTDDNLIVPGSSYGRRLFAARPGLNQIQGVVDELRRDRGSRRAAAVVWLPEDAVRESKDIPCTFGLFFHIREDVLSMTTVMRSNNALTLLPYNFFEFSMIGEMVAAELGVALGSYVHWVASMHIFDFMQGGVDQALSDTTRRSVEMPPMPRGDALESGRKLAVFEANLRLAPTVEDLENVATEARAALDDYWYDLFQVLYTFGLAKRGERDKMNEALARVPSYFADGMSKALTAAIGPEEEAVNDADDALFPLDELDGAPMPSRALLVAESTFARGSGQTEWLLDQLAAMQTGTDVTVPELLAVRGVLQDKASVALAARGAEEPKSLSARDVAAALAEVRNKSSE